MPRAPQPDDDDLPWLAEGVREERATIVPRARLVGGGIIALLLAVLVGLGVYLAVGHKSDGSGGYARPEDAPLIAADPGPYKVVPTDPGGAQITGIDDALAAAAGGNDVGSAIASDAVEEPLGRSASGTFAPPPTDLLPETIPPAPIPTRAVPVAPVVPPVVAPVATANLPAVAIPLAPKPADKPAKPAVMADAAKPELARFDSARPPPVTKPAKSVKPESKVADGAKPIRAGRDAAADPLAAPAGEPKPKAAIKAASDADTAVPKRGASLQLGAFSTRDKAEAAWRKAGGDGALTGLAQRIEPVERDGKTLYRLRAGGVTSKAAASALCTRVTAAGNACIVAE